MVSYRRDARVNAIRIRQVDADCLKRPERLRLLPLELGYRCPVGFRTRYVPYGPESLTANPLAFRRSIASGMYAITPPALSCFTYGVGSGRAPCRIPKLARSSDSVKCSSHPSIATGVSGARHSMYELGPAYATIRPRCGRCLIAYCTAGLPTRS